jgi:hypothetical protein
VSVHHAAPVTVSTIVVAVDVGKCSAVLSATDAARRRLVGPVGFGLTRSGLSAVVDRIEAAIGLSAVQVKVGVEAAGDIYMTSPIKRVRFTAAQIAQLDAAIYDMREAKATADHPGMRLTSQPETADLHGCCSSTACGFDASAKVAVPVFDDPECGLPFAGVVCGRSICPSYR